jgi:hypothetical protein
VSNKKFLIDTGSSFSILPFSSSARQSGPVLRAADGRRICCWGHRRTDISINGVAFTWHFLLADVQFPIIWVDFLRHFNLAVDVVGGQEGVPEHDAGRHHQAIKQLLGQPSPPGQKERWVMAAVRGFSPPEYSNNGGQVPFAQHGGPGWPPRRLLHIQTCKKVIIRSQWQMKISQKRP